MPRPFRRLIELRCIDGGVVGRVCDNVHDFTVSVSHDETLITRVTAHAARFPWTTCPAAIDRLKDLEGLSVAAITYYVVSLFSYLAKAEHDFGLAAVEPSIATAAFIPVAALTIWWVVRRIRSRHNPDDTGPD